MCRSPRLRSSAGKLSGESQTEKQMKSARLFGGGGVRQRTDLRIRRANAKQGGSSEPPCFCMKLQSDTRDEAPRGFFAASLERARTGLPDERITSKLLRDILVESEFLQYLSRDEHRADGPGMYAIPHQVR